jgi:uncharacterized membrane protein YjfL (UPF0719 family)
VNLLGLINPGFLGVLGIGIGAILLYAVLGVLLVLLGFYAVDLTTPGKLNVMVREGRPNSVVITAFGMVSMALIVVTAIYTSSGLLAEGLLQTLVFGLVGIVAQVGAVRLLEWVMRIDIGSVLAAERLQAQSFLIGAAHLAIGLVVAFAII